MLKDIFATMPEPIELGIVREAIKCDECIMKRNSIPLWRDTSSEDKVIGELYEVTPELLRIAMYKDKIDRLKEEMDGRVSFSGFYHDRLRNEYTDQMRHLYYKFNDQRCPEFCMRCLRAE